jgi:hypothetical protein
MNREVLADVELHSVDLGQEAACRPVIVQRIHLHSTEVGPSGRLRA